MAESLSAGSVADELRELVTAVVQKRRHNGLRSHELIDSIRRRRFPAEFLPVIEPLLHVPDAAVYKTAIDIVGKMKNASTDASDAIEAAWERSWKHDVPQAGTESFRALLRIGGNDDRLLSMIQKAMKVDNYGVHKECAEALMKISGGDSVLAGWSDTIAGQCECHLHQKLALKVSQHLNAG